MTKSTSSAVTISVVGPSPTDGDGGALAKLAASMAPGTWAKLSATNQDPVLGVGNSNGNMIPYCNSMPWNPRAKAIEIVSMDHNWGHQRYARYDAATNKFVLMSADIGEGSGTQHGYDHSTVNPHTGDLYYRRFTLNTGAITVLRKPFGSAATFSQIPSGPGQQEAVAIGSCWWSGTFAGAGKQGCLIVFNSGNAVGNASDGQIVAFDPLANAWFYNKTGRAPSFGPGATYHSLIEYSARRNVAVYGGGNVAPNKLWRLNADGSFNQLADVPAGKAVGIQRGVLVDDPVTGNFLLLSAGELWELNPTGAGTWTRQTGPRNPPVAVGVPGPTKLHSVIGTAIPEYGVVAYITQNGRTGGNLHLYKHA